MVSYSLKRAIVCFANIQEGRNAALLRDIAKRASAVPGAALLRIFSDHSFHRSGLCIAGEDDAVADAVFQIAAGARDGINLATPEHSGNHHHIGAVDLLPFSPLGEATLEDAAAVARTVGERMGRELGMSVIMYGAAHESNRSLVSVRKQTNFFQRGQEGHGSDAVQSGIVPDFGPATPTDGHGITLCGATPYVVNFNLMLDTADVSIAKQISKLIRGSSDGGLPGVQAMGYLKGTSQPGEYVAEVACNLTEPMRQGSNAEAVLKMVSQLAEDKGVHVAKSYSTNPLPSELEAWRMAGGPERIPPFDWRVAPGDQPFV
mmetsp:Transcript_16387/g.41365  ORF Transcript_16387/g.41365 Transcript_16387/m.41365 type:complete len:318 (+) Transcript_16387:46-999(+)